MRVSLQFTLGLIYTRVIMQGPGTYSGDGRNDKFKIVLDEKRHRAQFKQSRLSQRDTTTPSLGFRLLNLYRNGQVLYAWCVLSRSLALPCLCRASAKYLHEYCRRPRDSSEFFFTFLPTTIAWLRYCTRWMFRNFERIWRVSLRGILIIKFFRKTLERFFSGQIHVVVNYKNWVEFQFIIKYKNWSIVCKNVRLQQFRDLIFLIF